MLIGQYISKLTDKNRLSVPKKIRGELDREAIVARWYEGCLVLVSQKNWQKLIDRLVGTNRIITSPIRDIDRFIFASAFEVNLDTQGRFVLPQSLALYAGIVSEVVFIGLNDRVEIWAMEKWETLETEIEKKSALAIEKVAKEEKRVRK